MIVLNSSFNKDLEQTDNFVYLGEHLSSKEGTISFVKRRIGNARAAFQALGKVGSARDITATTELEVSETLVLCCLLYDSETWTMKRSSEEFEIACLRKILGIT